ncbi:hypothetical protein B0H15DRAFT_857019 [Mycena belliarum]|uniref:Secreted protein n=1 Tax=Mycena belliarum TaxID=1033014 RepID=A0AAD6XMI9_9AGAR|nr:hypothetical protein B0H15DRAFT_857019 [Mycena belliae]
MELVSLFLVIVWFLVLVVRPSRSLSSASTAVAPRRQGTLRPQASHLALVSSPAMHHPLQCAASFHDAPFPSHYTHPRRCSWSLLFRVPPPTSYAPNLISPASPTVLSLYGRFMYNH